MHLDLTIPAAILCACVGGVMLLRVALSEGERRAKERTARLLAEARRENERAGSDAEAQSA